MSDPLHVHPKDDQPNALQSLTKEEIRTALEALKSHVESSITEGRDASGMATAPGASGSGLLGHKDIVDIQETMDEQGVIQVDAQALTRSNTTTTAVKEEEEEDQETNGDDDGNEEYFDEDEFQSLMEEMELVDDEAVQVEAVKDHDTKNEHNKGVQGLKRGFLLPSPSPSSFKSEKKTLPAPVRGILKTSSSTGISTFQQQPQQQQSPLLVPSPPVLGEVVERSIDQQERTSSMAAAPQRIERHEQPPKKPASKFKLRQQQQLYDAS